MFRFVFDVLCWLGLHEFPREGEEDAGYMFPGYVVCKNCLHGFPVKEEGDE